MEVAVEKEEKPVAMFIKGEMLFKDDKTTKEISILKSKAEEEEEKVKKKEEVVEQIIETILRVQLHNLTSTVSCLSTMQLKLESLQRNIHLAILS